MPTSQLNRESRIRHTTIWWMTPPPRPEDKGMRNRVAAYNATLEELKRNPGQWALLPGAKATKPGSRTTSEADAMRRRGAEATVRTVDGLTYTYARWPEEVE